MIFQTPITYSAGAEPIQLNIGSFPTNHTFDGEHAEVAAWGSTSYGGPLASSLLAITIPIVPKANSSYFNDQHVIPQTMMVSKVENGNFIKHADIEAESVTNIFNLSLLKI